MTPTDRSLLRAIGPCLLLAVTPMLVHCGGDAAPATETGNPPGIARHRIYLELTAGGLRVVGRPAAITPPGSQVSVTNLSSGVSVDATAAADGTLDVVVPGAIGDEIQVTVTNGAVAASETVSFAEIARQSDLSGITCLALEHTLNGALDEVFRSADTTCATDADCAFVGWSVGAPCYYECAETLLSRAGATDARATGAQWTTSVCEALAACDRPPPSSCGGGPPPRLPTCTAGQCTAIYPDELSCDDLLTTAGARRDTLIAQTDRTCSIDSDCALAGISARCLIACGPGISVAKPAVQTLERNIQTDVDDALCGPVLDRACPYDEASCPELSGPPQTYCDAGTCALRYLE